MKAVRRLDGNLLFPADIAALNRQQAERQRQDRLTANVWLGVNLLLTCLLALALWLVLRP
jgi:hypothetical protein